MNPKLVACFKVVLFLALVYPPIFMHLENLPLRVWDEARLAISAHEMLQNHNYLIPHYKGNPDMWGTKPPLVIWTQAIFYKLFGMGELAVRLPSALAAFLTTLIIMLFSVKYLKSYWLGLISVLILITSYGYINNHAVRTGDLDAPLAFFTTLYCLSFFLFIELKERKYLHVFFLGLTLAILTKSVQGLLFVPALAIYVLIGKRFLEIVKNKWFYFDLLLCITIVLGYYLTREHYNPGYLRAVWKNELGGRYLSALEGHGYPFMFYYDQLISSKYAEWFLLVPCGIIAGFVIKDEKLKRLTLFSLLMIVSYWLIISISVTKCEWYDVPLYPFLGMMGAIAIHSVFSLLTEAADTKRITGFYLIPFLFLVIVFFKPYQKIIDKVYFPKENNHEINEMRISYLLKEAVQSKRSIKNQSVCYDGHNAHLSFYLIQLNEKDQHVGFKDWRFLMLGDIVIASQDKVKDYIEKNYLFEETNNYFNVKTYKIKGTRIGMVGAKEVPERKKTIYLKAFNGKYLGATEAMNHLVLADKDKASKLTILEKRVCKIVSDEGLFFSADLGQQNEITASRKVANDWETFTMIELDNNFVAFKAFNGKYWGIDKKSFQLSANSDTIGVQEKFRVINSSGSR
ncbi:MAG: glycosyltransferase family 39 protein [Bacteroidia bacterium]|nr:glycosyltransferase family 39 protein [Bacteroidia bacterium]